MSETTWKQDVYSRYNTLSGRAVNRSEYARFIPYGNHIISLCFPANKQSSILDIGCGMGGFIKVCVDSGYTNIRGVDISDENVALAHEAGLTQVVHGDIFKFLDSTIDQSFDIVLCLDVLEHLVREETIELLREVNRVLRPEGKVILHVPNAEGIFGSKIRYADYTHEQAFTGNSLGQVLRVTGFGSVECYEDKPIVHGITSLIRRCVWELITIQFRIIHAAETGSFRVNLSQNILAVGKKV